VNRQDLDEREPDPDDLLTVGEVSARSGVAVSALHYYESLGLIASSRTGGNQRRYPRDMIRRIASVIVAKRLGIPQQRPRRGPSRRAPRQARARGAGGPLAGCGLWLGAIMVVGCVGGR
jgi:hypothetical protein